VTLEGLGFTAFRAAAQFRSWQRGTHPVDMLYFRQRGRPRRVIANAEAAIGVGIGVVFDQQVDFGGNRWPLVGYDPGGVAALSK